MNEIPSTFPPEIDRYRRLALIAGIAGLTLCALGALFSHELRTQFFRSYLFAFVFWIGIPLGCLAILMLQHMSGGAWGLVIRRVLESATRTFPLLALLFIPILIGVRFLYVWAQPELVHGNELLEHKSFYLNVPFFIGRAVFYFGVWLALMYFLNKWSLEQDRTGDRMLTRKIQDLSGPGLVLYGLTVTFASIDWVMSLQPEWFSTIFGILFMGGQGVSAMSFVIAVLVLLSLRKPMSDVVAPRHFHDLGKLLLAFIMLWAYFSFSQFLIIWAGNLPEEIPWYVRRLNGPWKWVGLMLVLFHFALPFVMLLSRDLKRNGRLLAMVAIAVIIMRMVDLFWLIAPEFNNGHIDIRWMWMDLLALVGVGGIWLWFFASQLKARPLLPVQDPFLESVFTHQGGH